MDNIIEKTKICSECETENSESSVYCKKCGSYLEKKGLLCEYCGEEIEKDSIFCSSCGKKIKKESKLKNIQKGKIYTLVKASLITLISALLVIFSFLPFVTYTVDEDLAPYAKDDVTVEISAIDNIMFFFDSFENEKTEELEYEEELYEELEEIQSKMSELEYSYIYSEESREKYDDLAAEAYKVMLRITLHSNLVDTQPSIILSLVVSIFYIALAFTMLGISIFNLVRVILGKSVCFGKITALIALAPFAILFIHLTQKSGAYETGMGFAAGALVISLIAVALLICEKYIVERKVNIKKVICSTLCVLFSILVMCLSFSNAFVLALDGEFNGSSKTSEAEVVYKSSFFQELEMNEDAEELLYSESYNTDVVDAIEKIMASYTSGEIERGKAISDTTFLSTLVMYRWVKGTSVVFSSIFYVAALCALFAMLAGYKSVVSILKTERKHTTRTVFSLISLELGVVYLILDIVYVIMSNMMLEKVNIERTAEYSISVIPVFLIVFAIANFVSSIVYNKKKKAEIISLDQI